MESKKNSEREENKEMIIDEKKSKIWSAIKSFVFWLTLFIVIIFFVAWCLLKNTNLKDKYEGAKDGFADGLAWLILACFCSIMIKEMQKMNQKKNE